MLPNLKGGGGEGGIRGDRRRRDRRRGDRGRERQEKGKTGRTNHTLESKRENRKAPTLLCFKRMSHVERETQINFRKDQKKQRAKAKIANEQPKKLRDTYLALLKAHDPCEAHRLDSPKRERRKRTLLCSKRMTLVRLISNSWHTYCSQ